MNTQLALGITLRDEATFTNFDSRANQQVLRCLKQLLKGSGERIIYLWGQGDVGITHLLQACCHEAFQRQAHAIFLPLSEPDLTPEILQDLESVNVICIDDIEYVLGKPAWEEQLLHLYNRVHDGNSRLVIGAKKISYLTQCELPDLKSRLSWGLTLRVDGLSDAEKPQALQMRLARRGLTLSRQTAKFLCQRYDYNMKALLDVIETLDHAALMAKRRLTIPFIKKTLD